MEPTHPSSLIVLPPGSGSAYRPALVRITLRRTRRLLAYRQRRPPALERAAGHQRSCKQPGVSSDARMLTRQPPSLDADVWPHLLLEDS